MTDLKTIDLKNTYIETKDKELVNAYLEECERQGVKWPTLHVATDIDDIIDRLGRTISCNGRWLNNDTHGKAPANYKQITLADLKPKKTKVEFMKCEFWSSWEACKAFEEGDELYLSTRAGGDFTRPSDIYQVVGNHENLYRKVETEITWQNEAKKFFESYKNTDFIKYIDFKNESGNTVMQGDFIKMCHLVASMTDKPE